MHAKFLGFAALLCATGSPAHAADSWTPQKQLSGATDVYAGSGAAIDPRGDAVAVWVDQRSNNGSGIPDRLQARTRVAGAALEPSSTVEVTGAGSTIYYPQAYMSDAGQATAFWFDNGYIRYSDHSLGGHWTKAASVTLTQAGSNGFSSAFAIAVDHVGDQAVRVNNEVFVRMKGGQWHSVGQPLDARKYGGIQPLGDLLISPSGDVAAYQTTYDVVCSPPGSHHCRKVNLTLRLSRLRPGATVWQVAGANDRVDGDAHLLDDQGRLVFAKQTGSAVTITTQPAFGVPVQTITSIATTASVGGFGADAAGNASVLLNDTAAGQTVTYAGPLGGGTTWTRQALTAGSNLLYLPAYFKVSASGSATFLWQAASNTPLLAATRATGTAVWSAAVKLSDALPYYPVDQLAVAANNQAITIWTGFAGSTQAGVFSIHNPQ